MIKCIFYSGNKSEEFENYCFKTTYVNWGRKESRGIKTVCSRVHLNKKWQIQEQYYLKLSWLSKSCCHMVHCINQRIAASYNECTHYFRTFYHFNSAAVLNMINMAHSRRINKKKVIVYIINLIILINIVSSHYKNKDIKKKSIFCLH